jgi:hypothetical protein
MIKWMTILRPQEKNATCRSRFPRALSTAEKPSHRPKRQTLGSPLVRDTLDCCCTIPKKTPVQTDTRSKCSMDMYHANGTWIYHDTSPPMLYKLPPPPRAWRIFLHDIVKREPDHGYSMRSLMTVACLKIIPRPRRGASRSKVNNIRSIYQCESGIKCGNTRPLSYCISYGISYQVNFLQVLRSPISNMRGIGYDWNTFWRGIFVPSR